MTCRKSWLLMSVKEIAQMIVSNNGLFRKQKSYYKARNNTIMIARFQEAENSTKGIVQQAGE
jgi:hypothetical protein